MATFPSLSVEPSYPVVIKWEDSVIRSPMEGGYEVTRQKFTRVRRTWDIVYNYLPSSDVTTFNTFVESCVHGGADAFTWTIPGSTVTATVRFKEPPEVSIYDKSGTGYMYSAKFTVTEV